MAYELRVEPHTCCNRDKGVPILIGVDGSALEGLSPWLVTHLGEGPASADASEASFSNGETNRVVAVVVAGAAGDSSFPWAEEATAADAGGPAAEPIGVSILVAAAGDSWYVTER